MVPEQRPMALVTSGEASLDLNSMASCLQLVTSAAVMLRLVSAMPIRQHVYGVVGGGDRDRDRDRDGGGDEDGNEDDFYTSQGSYRCRCGDGTCSCIYLLSPNRRQTQCYDILTSLGLRMAVVRSADAQMNISLVPFTSMQDETEQRHAILAAAKAVEAKIDCLQAGVAILGKKRQQICF